MSLSDLTSADAVLSAMAECEELGEPRFLKRYGFLPSRSVQVEHNGKLYPSKPILAAAHAVEHPDQGPLRPGEFSGGRETIAKLRQLGFDVQQGMSTSRQRRSQGWVIRGGPQDRWLTASLEEGWIGLGWPRLPDLSELGEEELERAMDLAFAAERPASIGQYKSQIRSFLSIREGDVVLEPIPSRREVAVGRVLGGYQHFAGGPENAHHRFPVRWEAARAPRERLRPLLRWIDRPASITRIPREDVAEVVMEALRTGAPISDSAATEETSLRNTLEAVLEAVGSRDANTVRDLVEKPGVAAVQAVVGDEWPVRSGAGMGTPAQVPWISVQPKGTTESAQRGFYLVYLFAADGSAVFLSLNQGTENLRGGTKPLLKRALDLRAAAGLTDAGESVKLAGTTARPAKYEAGSALAIRYPRGAVPAEEELEGDLKRMLELLEAAQQSGLTLDPEIEPLHLLFKWSTDRDPETLADYRALAEKNGRAWWGRVGTVGIEEGKLSQLREQLKRGIPTFAFIYGGGELVKARIDEISTDPAAVNQELLPGHVDKSECSLFALTDKPADLDASWALESLVLASNPDPAKMPGALGNTSSLLSVYQRFLGSPESHAEPAAAAAPPDRAWLLKRTLWEPEPLEELLSALDPETGRGQVILTGPPGTGKTWIAKSLARYLTQDQPLRHRVVQLHPSYGYEEFVEGVRPVARQGAVSFERRDGVILRMARETDDTNAPHVLVVDELNRANVPRVFGELLYLLEYREETIDLQYSEAFKLPQSLLLIATMNTADRSIRSIDVALRRRFEIFECAADPAVLARFYEQDANVTEVAGLVDGFSRLNEELTQLIDRHHNIGQSFFMRQAFTWETLTRTWRRQIMPLIEDYFFDQPDVAEQFTLERFWPGP